MMILRAFLLLVAFMASARAETVSDVLSGNTVQLSDGRIVRLYGITTKPDESAAVRFLQEWVRDKDLKLQSAPQSPDRNNNIVAQLLDDKGASAQKALIDAGLARVFTLPGNADIAPELLTAEAASRKAKRGLWHDEYKILDADTVKDAMNSFAIVDAIVVNVATAKGVMYVNFGADWKTDFTLSLAPVLAKQMNVDDWVGKEIRVRGWVYEKNGPMIAVTHAEQVELNP